MTETEAYTKLSEKFRRFEIQVTEMIDITHNVKGIIYCGMGDFLIYKGQGKSLAEAVDNCLKGVLC